MIGRTNTGGGGGGGLNFQVVGGTTAPNNPKENMIWINTDQKITSYIFSANEPSNPTEGMVWISVGTSSEVAFNALKKNGIQVYPISAQQYVSDSWQNVEAESYLNGEWVQYAKKIYFVKDGLLNTKVGLNGVLRSGQSVSVTQANGYVRVNAKNAYTGGIATDVAYDVTDFSTLTLVCAPIKLLTTSGFSGLKMGLSRGLNYSDSTQVRNCFVSSTEHNANGTGKVTLTCDISNVNGEYYPAIALEATSSTLPDVYIYDFYLS